MNINRQAGRRRGRGGQRQGGGGNPQGNNGNRIDSRARGNANQLYEKYKTLAADAQRQGDRVNTEYYLQFADHYFRVLAENRSRFEEQNPGQARRPQDSFDDEETYDDDGNEVPNVQLEQRPEPRRDTARDDRGNRDTGRNDRGNRYGNGNYADNDSGDVTASDDRDVRSERQPRKDRPQREERQPREAREPRAESQPREAREPRADSQPREERQPREPREPRSEDRPRRGRPPRAVQAVEGETFDASLLPPSLGISVASEGDEPAAPKPRRRRVRPTEEADAAE